MDLPRCAIACELAPGRRKKLSKDRLGRILGRGNPSHGPRHDANVGNWGEKLPLGGKLPSTSREAGVRKRAVTRGLRSSRYFEEHCGQTTTFVPTAVAAAACWEVLAALLGEATWRRGCKAMGGASGSRILTKRIPSLPARTTYHAVGMLTQVS